MRRKAIEPSPSLTLRCAVYTRKSSAQGLEQAFNSLDAQREACLHFIQSQAHLGWLASNVSYTDGGFTGSNLDRPGFQSLLNDVEAGALDVVVVYKVDRLSRSLMDFSRVMERFNAKGVAFVSVTQNFSTVDAMGRLTLNMLMSFAEFEREMITERIRDKVSAARRKGRWTGGFVPFGYHVVEKQLQVSPEEATWVRWLFETYLEGKSVLELVQTLNENQVANKSAVCLRANPWSKSTVVRILRNRLYLGVMASNGKWYPGLHAPLIQEKDFEQVQGLLAHQSHRTGMTVSRNTHYLVRGTLRCGTCGAAMTSASSQRHGRTYRYYRCTTREKKGKRVCPTRQLPAEAIEGFVVDQLRRAIREGQIAPAALVAHAQRLAERQRQLVPELDASIKNPEETSPWSKPGDGIECSRIACAKQIHALKQEEADLRWVSGLLINFDALWELLTPENRKRLIQCLVRDVVVIEDAGTLRITLRNLSAEDLYV